GLTATNEEVENSSLQGAPKSIKLTATRFRARTGCDGFGGDYAPAAHPAFSHVGNGRILRRSASRIASSTLFSSQASVSHWTSFLLTGALRLAEAVDEPPALWTQKNYRLDFGPPAGDPLTHKRVSWRRWSGHRRVVPSLA